MRATAIEGYLHTVGGGENGTGTTRHLTRGKWQDVLSERHADVTNYLRQTVVNHRLGTFTQFFGRLK